MRNIFLFCLCIISIRSSSQTFSLKGVITFWDNSRWDSKIYLLKINTLDNLFCGSRINIVDSTLIDDKGHFEFTNSGVIENNCFYRLNILSRENGGNGGAIYMGGTRENFIFLLLNKTSQIRLLTEADKFNDKLIFTKSDKPNYLIYRLGKIRNVENHLIDTLFLRKKMLDPSLITFSDSLKAINSLLANAGYATNTYENIKVFADTVKDPYVSLLAACFLPDDTYSSFLSKMNARYQSEIPKSKYTTQFNAMVKGEQLSLAVGTKAPAITLPDQHGETFNFSNLSGKYVLIDFWASWCSPCRNENVHNIKPLYQKYRDRGFTVLSVSQDIDKNAWLNAINTDGINIWYHVSDLKGQASPITRDYTIPYVPYNYLIDRQGNIIAVNLIGNKLEDYVDSLFK